MPEPDLQKFNFLQLRTGIRRMQIEAGRKLLIPSPPCYGSQVSWGIVMKAIKSEMRVEEKDSKTMKYKVTFKLGFSHKEDVLFEKMSFKNSLRQFD